jgi:hypothetical protein
MIRFFSLVYFILIIVSSCSKNNRLSDFSNIYTTDGTGNIHSGDFSDNQWQNKAFTESEMALFNDLDTANIAGTSMPSLTMVRYAIPNPFVDYFGVPLSLNADFAGDIVVKYVIVNRAMKAVQKGVQRLHATSNAYFHITPAFASGKYRLYFTISAESQEHFYKSWGNIERQ